MQVAAHDVDGLRRAVGGCAGAAVALYGALALLPAGEPGTLPTAALGVAGAALLLLASAGRDGTVRTAGRVLAALATATGAAGAHSAPATAVAVALAGTALGLLDLRLLRRLPIALPLLAAAALTVAVLSLPVAADAVPGGPSAAVAAALLILAGGAATLVAPDPTQPDPAQPDPAQPDPAQPDPAQPDPAQPDPAQPDPARPDATQPGPTQPGPVPAGPVPAGPVPAGPVPAGPLDRPGLADTLLESAGEAMMVLDANYRVLDVNRRWRELTGHPAEDAVGRLPPYPWVPDVGSGDRLLHRSDGTGVPVVATVAAVPDPDGRPGAYVATYVDAGQHRRVEEELAERASELEAGNSRLREANTRLESALAFKDDLMSMLTHDMAQPMTSIVSLSGMLTADWVELTDDVRLDLATRIDRNMHRLIRMTEDLLLLFRLDSGSVTARRRPVPVREVVASVAAELATHEVRIEVDAELAALVDRQHLWHVVRNLLNNAAAYGNPPIEVLARREADHVILVVQDRGPGIPAELVPKLFDRFMRGAGLGLFIVRHLVQANGGSVRYERAEPQGARLVVSLEADAPHS